MRFLNWLSATATGLLSLYYKHRGKAYVRLSLMLVGIGGGIFALRVIAELILQTTIKQLLGPAADVPWWIAIALIGIGVMIFVGFSLFDPDVFKSTKNEGAITLAIPANWTFEQAARVIGKIEKKPVDLSSLTALERGAVLVAHQVSAPNAGAALKQLRSLAPVGVLREYDVIAENNQFVVRPI